MTSPGETPKPSILLVTMPKSGSIFLRESLARGLAMERMSLGNGYTLEDQVHFIALKHFVLGQCISQNHFSPSPLNVQLLQNMIDRWVVHIRDPRQAIWSWIKHLDIFKSEGREETFLWFYPTLPEEYFQYTLDKKIDWQIENHFPGILTWLRGWLKVCDSENRNVLLTTYDEIIEDSMSLVLRILEFYEIDRSDFNPVPIQLNRDVHFRSGDPTEWRSHFSKRQVASCRAIMPDYLFDRFGWPK